MQMLDIHYMRFHRVWWRSWLFHRFVRDRATARFFGFRLLGWTVTAWVKRA